MEAREAERQRALEMCEQMRVRYAQLDIFKLDVIARELKKVDQGVEGLRREARDVVELIKGGHGKESDRERAITEAMQMVQRGGDLRAHVRDVIERCLSETQKLHIGSAVVDRMAAGELQDGGVLQGFVAAGDTSGPERPATSSQHGASRASKLRTMDELRREQEKRTIGGEDLGRQPSPSA
eukprot:TRINITY_DN22566_c0_g1_i1.p1 TRINITY_DN22566_c0_g1~~TRINITY_DN22566_c0_g1_i1.p1  ORF type:complete len:182 (-),score=31.05 TRINITY_DN22566_c0_g1_i1:373-918(-)